MKLASIGCGNMGGALLQRWLDQQVVARADVQVCVADEAAAAAVRERYGVTCGTDLIQAIRGADDNWSGRTNDVSRARHDGVLRAIRETDREINGI